MDIFKQKYEEAVKTSGRVCQRVRDRERAVEKTESRKEIKSPFLFKRKRS